MSYDFISKTGTRILKNLKNPPKHLLSKHEKNIKDTTPPFLYSPLPTIEESKQYKTERDWKFLPGDRVVIINGDKRGNICKIKQHNQMNNGYLLDENGPSKEAVIPKDFWAEGQTSFVSHIPQLVKREDIRLIADIEDTEIKGKFNTVVIRDVEFKGSYYDEHYKKVLPYRYVRGSKNLIIPWPTPSLEDKKTGSVEKLSTSPEIVREQTYWVNSLVKNSIPRNAISTIRNVHSKYRRRSIARSDLVKLVAPKMPLTETKKAYKKDKEEVIKIMKENKILKDEDYERIGNLVKKKLEENNIQV